MTEPLALYVHWPFCVSKCPYCDFNSHVRESVDQAVWRDALLADLRHEAALLAGRRVSSIFFGGGTPSLMPPATVAAVIAEPVVGASAGALVPPDGWWSDVRSLCDEHGVLLIADEVMTGFGRTGKRFGVDHWDVVPDVLVGGKGLSGGYAPLGGVYATEAVVAPIAASGEGLMFFTYSAHSATCAAGLATLRILEDEDLVAASAAKGADLLGRLAGLAAHPAVTEVRGLGLMVGIELGGGPGSGLAGAVVAEAMARGAWVYPAGDGNLPDALLLGPPFTITDGEMDEVVRIVTESVDAVCGG